MLHPDTLSPGKAAGYPGGFSYYVVGRGGVLGDVDASVVVSAFAFFAPSLVRSLWEAGVVVEGARKASDRYALACAEWGRQRLGAFAHAERLAELLAKIVDHADPTGLVLFAGWQTQACVDDALGRCYQLLHALRELRGACILWRSLRTASLHLKLCSLILDQLVKLKQSVLAGKVISPMQILYMRLLRQLKNSRMY